jgi:ParB/RepB/Spo0J family partition protein
MKKAQSQIPISNILVEDRIREDFGDMLDFKDSIEKHGVIQPITVQELPSGKYKLLTGGRRVRACTELSKRIPKLATIPAYIFTGEIDDITLKEIELEENFQRKDLSFVERNRIIGQIHELMIAKHGKRTSTASDAKGWTMDDTADKLNKSRASVSNALEMNEAIRLLPELADAKNESEARKKYKQAENTIIREMMMTEIAEKRNLLPIDKQRAEIAKKYIVGDCREEAKKIPDSSMHLVEIDWPFAIDLEDYRDEYEDIPKEEYIPFIQSILAESKRILNPKGWLIVWYASEPWQEVVFLEIKKLGLRTRRVPGYWEKSQGETKRPAYFLSTNQETFYYAGGLDSAIVRQGRSNRWDQSPVPQQFKIHRTQKPVTLYDDIFSTFVMPGTKGVTMCAGSGNAILSGSNLGIDITGFDINKEYQRSFIANVYKGKPGEYHGWET